MCVKLHEEDTQTLFCCKTYHHGLFMLQIYYPSKCDFNSFLEQPSREFLFRHKNMYVVYFFNWYISLTAFELNIYVCILM